MTAGGNLEWVRNLFGNPSYQDIFDTAFDRPPSNLLYLPYLNGERSPFSDPLAQAAFVGINARTETGDMYRAVLEGVAYAYRHCLEALINNPIESLVLTGGGTRTESWCQLFADVTGVPVILPEEGQHSGIRGTLMSARVAQGSLTSYVPTGSFSPPVRRLEANARLRSMYDRGYAQFRALYPALKDIFTQMNTA